MNRLFRWSRIERAGSPRLAARILALVAITWLPLFLMCLFQGTAWGGKVRVPLLYDPAVMVRFLFSVPLLVAAELLMSREFGSTSRYLRSSGLTREEDTGRFNGLIEGADQLFNSVAVEIVIIVLLIVAGLFHFEMDSGLGRSVSNWQRDQATGALTAAGLWHQDVSVFVFRFILLRWLWRFVVWTRFLWQVSRLDLKLMHTHPDLSGGLGILEQTQSLFSLVVMALSAQVAGFLSRSIFFAGATVQSYYYVIAGVIAMLVTVFIMPLCIFRSQLFWCKRQGLLSYGSFAERYADLFEEKWMTRPGQASQEVLGSSDIQSLADLANGYAVVRNMRMVPFSRRILISLAAAAAIPFLPLALFVYRFDELMAQVLRLLF